MRPPRRLFGEFNFLTQLCDLMFFIGNSNFARADEITVNIELLDRCFDAIQVFVAKLNKFGKFLRPTTPAVVDAMCK